MLFSIQIITFIIFYKNWQPTYIKVWITLFLLYFIYNFYHIFKFHRDKKKSLKAYMILRNIFLAFVFAVIILGGLAFSYYADSQHILQTMFQTADIVDKERLDHQFHLLVVKYFDYRLVAKLTFMTGVGFKLLSIVLFADE